MSRNTSPTPPASEARGSGKEARQRRTDIALLIHDLPFGGAERCCITLASKLVDAGLRVQVLTAQANGEWLSEIPDGAEHINLDAPRPLSLLRSLYKYFRRTPPRSVLAFMETVGCIAILARLLSGADSRTVVSIRVLLSRHLRNELSASRLFKRIWTARLLLPHADAISAVSNVVARDAEGLFWLKTAFVSVVSNPVLPSRRAEVGHSPAHPWMNDGQPEKLVISAGRMVDQKDHLTLLEAFDRLTRVRKSRLIIFGDGPLRNRLLEKVASLRLGDRVDLPGVADLSSAFPFADLFVLTSRYEGSPNALLEAIAAGCPVVSTNWEGAEEILPPVVEDSLAPIGDAPEICRAMMHALDQGDELAVRQRNGIRNNNVDESVAAYRSLLRV